MSDNTSSEATTSSTDAAEDVTDFASVLMQVTKGAVQREASLALAEVVAGAIETGKKGGHVTVKLAVEARESGAVAVVGTVTKKVPEDPAASLFFADGEGHLSRDNSSMYYANR